MAFVQVSIHMMIKCIWNGSIIDVMMDKRTGGFGEFGVGLGFSAELGPRHIRSKCSFWGQKYILVCLNISGNGQKPTIYLCDMLCEGL